MTMTWDAILAEWPWFAAAAGVLIVVVALLVLLKPKSKRQPNTIGSAADNKGWVLTGRIDFVDPHSAGELVLQVKKRSKKLKADGDGTSKESDGDQPNKETECSGIKRKD